MALATTRPLALALAMAVAATFGCAFGEVNLKDPFDRKYTLGEAQHQYTEYVRWSEFQRAASYLDADIKTDFLRRAPSKRKVRFTDYETGHLEIDPETGTATVDVTYFVYRPEYPLEVEVVETQHWERDGVTNNWKVLPTFAGLAELEDLQSAEELEALENSLDAKDRDQLEDVGAAP